MNNGRINIMGPNKDPLFGLYSQDNKNKSTSYKNAMVGNLENTVLSNAFFSADNIQIIQNGIKAGVYHLSNGQHVIGNQDEDTLKIIMRSTFLQFSNNNPNNITQQIIDLNKLVTEYCIPNINNEADAYLKYKKDVSTLAVPHARPKSTYHSNTLEFKGFF
tara:strand:+ start:1678 stop:2160 length:483 start_codon:yes stop_codon:yes gene_type:complete